MPVRTHKRVYLVLSTVCLICLIGLGTATAQPQNNAPVSSSSHKQRPVKRQNQSATTQYTAQRKKIELALDSLDAEGLRGPADGKVAVSYEFCIPDTRHCRKEVKRLDATVQFMPGSSGRIKAQKGQCLCIGSIHQAHWQRVLTHLAALPYVHRIIEASFE